MIWKRIKKTVRENPVYLKAGILAAAAVIFLYYYRLCKKQFGGTTGDLAGYFLQLCELGMLAALVLAGGFLWK